MQPSRRNILWMQASRSRSELHFPKHIYPRWSAEICTQLITEVTGVGTSTQAIGNRAHAAPITGAVGCLGCCVTCSVGMFLGSRVIRVAGAATKRDLF
jgi:hypothetical protein